jgi:hypothetical protein
MQNHNLLSTPGKVVGCFVLLALMSTVSAAQNNTFSGTYTFVVGIPDDFTIQTNMFGQEVGFCPNGSSAAQLPFGYSCGETGHGQDVLTGTLIADGNGNITTGSTFVFTPDVNGVKCSSTYNATPDCPYKVPAGITWSSTTSYVVGDEVDFTVSGTLLTFQAVQNNTGVAPNTSTCTSTVGNPPNCDWDQLNLSATAMGTEKGTLTGTYTVQSNGSAVAKLTVVTPTGKMALSFAMVVPTAPLAVGQVVPMAAMPTVGNEFTGSGAAVRVQ